MTHVTQGAYIAALEKKLMEAERALYGFRAIWNNLQANGLEDVRDEEGPRQACSLPSEEGYPKEPECDT